LLATHAERRTLIYNTLSLGVSVNIVINWTCRSEGESMKPNIDIANQIKTNNDEKV